MKMEKKRLLSALLAVVLLLSAVVPAVYAADVEEYNLTKISFANFSELKTNSQAAYPEGSNWQLEDYKIGGSSGGKYYNNKFSKLFTYQGDYLVFRIKKPGSGIHTVSMTHGRFQKGGVASVYILPATTSSLDIQKNLIPDNRIGKVDFYIEYDPVKHNDVVGDYKTVLGYWDFGETPADEYYMIVECSENCPEYNYGYMYPQSIYFEAGVTKQPSSFGVAKSAVVSSDTIRTFEVATYSATGMIDGQPHLFIPIEGKKMYVYNLETGAKYDEIDTVFTVVRGITMDKDGILWLAGSQYFIQRYDPATRTITTYGAFNEYGSSAHDLIVGDNGKLYFGTSTSTAAVMEFDPETGIFRSLGAHNKDAAYSCGLAYDPTDGGYIYAALTGDKNSDGNKVNEVVKIRISDGKLMGRTDISDCVHTKEIMVRGAALMGRNYIAGGIDMLKTVAINVDTMKQTTLYYGNTAVTNVISTGPSEIHNNKRYISLLPTNKDNVTGSVNKGVYSVDANGKVEFITNKTAAGMHCGQDSIIEINGDPCLMLNGSGGYRYVNLNTKKMISLSDLISNDDGTGVTLQTMAKGENGEFYVGAFNNNKCLTFSTVTGKQSDFFKTNGQTDTMIWYDGMLYSGNYKDGVLIRVNMEDSAKNEVLLDFRYGKDPQGNYFDQVRVHAIAAGDDKVFAGTMPDSYKRGGCIGWYDIKTGEKYIERNVVPNQSINSLYYDAANDLLYGTTTTAGGTGAGTDETLSAKIFIYDVAEREVLRIIDLADPADEDCYLDLKGTLRALNYPEEGEEAIRDTKVRIPHVATLIPDPNFKTNGVLWGVVADRLFTFKYDKNSGEVQVEQKFETDTTKDPFNSGGATALNIEFLNGYIYVALNGGFYKINSKNFTDYTRLPVRSPRDYIVGDDQVLYYTNDETLYAYPLVVTADDEAAAKDVMTSISKLQLSEDLITDTADARKAFEELNWAQKSLVRNLYLLEEAEADSLEKQINSISTATPAQINEMMRVYNGMSAQQKRYVLNYADLYSAFSNQNTYAIGDTSYKTLSEAMENAAAGTVVKLLKDVEENDVEVPGGVTLDLNGCFLITDTIDGATLGNAHVIDSSGGQGLVKVSNEEKSFILYQKNEAMPLYDRLGEGYRFFSYQLTVDPEPEKDGASVRNFWYRLTFDSQQAYTMIAKGYTQMTIGAEVYVDGQRALGVTFVDNDSLSKRDFVAGWATAMLNRPSTTWLYAKISNFDKVDEDRVVGVKPYIQSCGVLACTDPGEPDTIVHGDIGIDSGFAPHP